MSCVFCSIVENNDPHHEIVWEDERHIAFLSKQSAHPGHTLVIPREHIDYVFDLPSEAYSRLMEAGRKLAGPLKAHSGSERIAVAIDGFQVPHVHVHLVPVNKTGDLCMPTREPSAEELHMHGEALRAVYKDIV